MSRLHFQDRTVVVAGGSTGLGFALARAFARQGSRLCLIARNEDRLATACRQLADDGARSVASFPADLTQDQPVIDVFLRIRREVGPVDLLVNAAGQSDRAAILDVTPERFQQAWELNFLGAVRCLRAASGDLIQQRGQVVMIGSLASKLAAPYLGAYPPSKFALAAYCQQLRFELGPQGVHVLLVCPGPIRRVDGGQRYDDRTDGLPESARRPGGGAGLSALDPDRLAERILVACRQRRPELVVPGKVRWLAALAQFMPGWVDRLIVRRTR